MRNFDKIFDRGKRREDDFSRGGRERPKMHKAICDSCGKSCELPFKPMNDKPVYCSQCFSDRGEGRSSRGEGRPNREEGRTNRRFQDKRMFDATCDKCGKRFELPFKPTGERDVYCSECFKGDGNVPSPRNDNQSKEQMDLLNKKMDKVIDLLTSILEKETEKKVEKEVEKKVERKVEKETKKKVEKKIKEEKKEKPKKKVGKLKG